MSESQGFNADKKAKQRREAPVEIGGIKFRRRKHTNGLDRELHRLARDQMSLNLRSEAKGEQVNKAIKDEELDRADTLMREVDDLDSQATDLNYAMVAAQLKPGRVSETHIDAITAERALEAARAESSGNEKRAEAIANEKKSELRPEVAAELKELEGLAGDTDDDGDAVVSVEFLRDNLEMPDVVPLMQYLGGGRQQEDETAQAAAEEGPTPAS